MTDQYAVMAYNGVPPATYPEGAVDARAEEPDRRRTATSLYDYAINCRRITDVKVRQALNYAWPLQQIRTIYGGPTAGEYATTVISPDMAGQVKFDPYGKLTKPQGDTAKAKALLKEAGKLGQKIVYTYPQGGSDAYAEAKVVIAARPQGGGLRPVIKRGGVPTSYYDQVSKVDNSFDMMWFGWSPDWPTG